MNERPVAPKDKSSNPGTAEKVCILKLANSKSFHQTNQFDQIRAGAP